MLAAGNAGGLGGGNHAKNLSQGPPSAFEDRQALPDEAVKDLALPDRVPPGRRRCGLRGRSALGAAEGIALAGLHACALERRDELGALDADERAGVPAAEQGEGLCHGEELDATVPSWLV
jgi:hypothetical protein